MRKYTPRIFFRVVFFMAIWAVVFSTPLVGFSKGKIPSSQFYLPDLVLCGKKQNSLFHVRLNHLDWEYSSDGPLKDVQPQPQTGLYLVTGASSKVALIQRAWKSFKTIWDWTSLKGVSIESAVVANWDEKDNPALILAADSLTPRIFLADAKSKDPQIRWEFKLSSPPRRIHLCTDTGNFLVILRNSTVEEIYFQKDKVGWSLGPANGLKDARDAVRDPWANTYIADAGTGDLLCFGPKKRLKWRTPLCAASASIEEMSLGLFRKNGKRLLLASVHFSRETPMGSNVVYVLNTETGKILISNDHDEKGSYPAFLRAVPAKAEYFKKQ